MESRLLLQGKAFLIIFFLLRSFSANSQTYGLIFAGQEVNKDKRTGLDLSSEAPFEFSKDFELSFDISFNPNKLDYFGYIVRIIMDNTYNFDLLHNVQDMSWKDFCLVAGSKHTSINFDLPKEMLFDTWRTFRIRFDLKNDQILFFEGKNTYSEKNVGLKKNASFKILFGLNTDKVFHTTDVTPMRIRNIRIRTKDEEAYEWPLNEKEGNISTDLVQGKKASVMNQDWMSPLYFNWHSVATFSMKGVVQVAFDPSQEVLYFLGSDSIQSFSSKGQKLSVKKFGPTLLGEQIIFDSITGRLYNYSVDSKFVSLFDLAKDKWNVKLKSKVKGTNFWHHNKVVSEIDTSLYIFGGYGHHKFKNLIQKVNFRTNQWEVVSVKGSFYPRYLAAAGKNKKGDTIYLLGGYGSQTGEQILNPQNYYDLLAYSIKNKTITKIYEQSLKDTVGFSFANSLIIDPVTNHYYGLTFPQTEFNCQLQLIEGSLSKPEYQLVGSKIPFKFYDIKAYADLFYCSKTKELLAVTIYADQNNSEVRIYSLNYPPNTVYSLSGFHKQNKSFIWVILSILILLALTGMVIFRNIKSREEELAPLEDETPEDVQKIIKYDKVLQEEMIVEDYKNAILLFGDFQIFGRDGLDITNKFSPLLRELFLIILLYSLKNSKGISVEKLDEVLWFDKDEKSARNNRAVNLVKLKEILTELNGCQLNNSSGYCKINCDLNEVFVDYHQVVSIIKRKTDIEKSEIITLLKNIQSGSLLNDLSYEWLDDFKSQISNDLIDTLIKYASTINIHAEPNLLVSISDAVFRFDCVNEDAMAYKCKALIMLGKHSLAKQTYSKFINEYKLLYNIDYKDSFNTVSKL